MQLSIYDSAVISFVDAPIAKVLDLLLERSSFNSIVVISPAIPQGIARYAAEQPHASISHVVFKDIDSSISNLGRFEFAFVHDTLEHLERSQAQQLVGRLRDLHAKLLWASLPCTDAESGFNRQDAIAQGMRAVETVAEDDSEHQLYEFSLQFYKPPPRWLNAENWAIPDMWDKRRW